MYSFGSSFQAHSSSDMATADGDLAFFSDPFPFDEATLSSSSTSVDPFSSCFFSFSPPSTHLENLTLQANSSNNNRLAPTLETDFATFSSSGFDVTQVVKSEECHQIGSFELDYGGYNNHNQQHFFPHSYSGGAQNVAKYMQRSFSSNSFHCKPANFLFQNNHSHTLNNNNNNNNTDSPNFQKHDASSPENSGFNGKMRRVCSTGDLQCQTELEEPNFKVGRYSAEERKERISKYRAKRSQRNFNKTIKYACRKTLADNRPRIRGRFARNDEASDIIPIPNPKQVRDDEDEEVDFWIEGLQLHEEQEDVAVNAYNNYASNQFQYCHF